MATQFSATPPASTSGTLTATDVDNPGLAFVPATIGGTYGNLVVDARFDHIPDTHEHDIAAIPGVVESGLFVGYPVEIVEPD